MYYAQSVLKSSVNYLMLKLKLRGFFFKKVVLVGWHVKNSWCKLERPRSAPSGVDRLEAAMGTLVLRVFQYS